LTDAAQGVKISLRVSYFRKPGQSGVNPQLPTQLTQGQFESSARFEMYHLGEP
jgi:DsbC/DsbD-like thiol-disulfide interchange protein